MPKSYVLLEKYTCGKLFYERVTYTWCRFYFGYTSGICLLSRQPVVRASLLPGPTRISTGSHGAQSVKALPSLYAIEPRSITIAHFADAAISGSRRFHYRPSFLSA
jgi:hypothetical protein